MDRTSIMYSPLSKRWTFLRAKQSWLVENPADAAILCGYFPIKISGVNDPNLIPGGRLIILKSMETSVRLNYEDFQGKPISGRYEETLEISPISKGHVTFDDGLHSDGWLEVNACLKYSQINTIEFEVYLPEANHNARKQLNLIVNDLVVKDVFLGRGKITQFKLAVPPEFRDEGAIFLKMDSRELSTNSGDERDLGAVLVKVNIDGSGWINLDETGWI